MTAADPQPGPLPSPAPGRPWSLAGDRGAVLALTGLWVLMIVLVRPGGNFPLMDDWIYARSVRWLVEDHVLRAVFATPTTLVAQVLWGALFCLPGGFSFTALRVSGLVAGLISLLAMYGLLREVGARPRLALLATLTLAVNPIFLVLSASFMTDVPSLAASVLCAWMLLRGVRRGRALDFAAGCALAGCAVMIRQTGILLPLAFGAAYLWGRGVTRRRLLIAALPAAVCLLLVALHTVWLRPLMGMADPLHSTSWEMGRGAAGFLASAVRLGLLLVIYAGLFMLPLSLALWPARWRTQGPQHRRPTAPQQRRRTPLLSAAAALLLTLGLLAVRCPPFAHKHRLPLAGNSFGFNSAFIVGSPTLRDTFEKMLPHLPTAPTAFWIALTLVAVAGAVLLLQPLGRGLLRRESWPALMAALTIALYLLALGFMGTFFDRYVVWAVPFAAVLLVFERGSPWLSGVASCATGLHKWLSGVASCATGPDSALAGQSGGACHHAHEASFVRRDTRRPYCAEYGTRVVVALLLAASLLVSVAGTHDYFSWNRARWAALDELTQSRGVPPTQIDGGPEFDAWNNYLHHWVVRPGRSWWWVDRDDYIVAFGPLPGFREIMRLPWTRWMPPGEGSVVVLYRPGGTPPPPPGSPEAVPRTLIQ